MGQFIPILVFMQLTGNGVAFGIVGIFEVVQIKHLNIFTPIVGRVPCVHPSSGPQIIHKAYKISVSNRKFKGSARWQ